MKIVPAPGHLWAYLVKPGFDLVKNKEMAFK